nr:3-oxo-delta(4,5)-steroid 5-beta-reductase [Tanacetum cinerariifolium]
SYDLDPILRSRSCKDKNDLRWDRDLDSLEGSFTYRSTLSSQNVFLVDIFGYYEQEQRAWVFSRSMLEMMKDKGPFWDEIVMKNELFPTKLDQFGGWWFIDTISSMKKTKKSKVKKVF